MIYANFTEYRAVLPTAGALIAFDYGKRKIGVAASDSGRMLASPVMTLHRKRFDIDLEALNALIAQRQVCGIIIGLPLNMDGSHGQRAQSTKAFARNLAKTINLPIGFWDERLSTEAAQDILYQNKKSGSEDDAIAAALILQEVLNALTNTRK